MDKGHPKLPLQNAQFTVGSLKDKDTHRTGYIEETLTIARTF